MALSYRIGVAARDITPPGPILLAGYGGNDRKRETTSCPIYAKALIIEDLQGARVGIVALDLCGIDATTVACIEAAAEKVGIAPERLVINSSHNHSAPNFDTTLSLYYEPLPEDVDRIRVFTGQALQQMSEVLQEAAARLEPMSLSYGMSLAGIGVNRRRHRSRGPGAIALPQVVDHDVPVLTARAGSGQLRAILFGYACHTTSLCGKDLNGDYAGYACREIEEANPGALAIYLAGCGADINPLPRYTMALSRAYGSILAAAVQEGIDHPDREIHGSLRADARRIRLATLPVDDPAAVRKIIRNAPRWPHGMKERILAFIDEELAKDDASFSVPYRTGVLDFGDDLRLIALSGETVVDYSLALKAEYGPGRTWVAGYCDALTPYIPSLRVLKEGSYEGTESMPEYGYPQPFTHEVETAILNAVKACIG